MPSLLRKIPTLTRSIVLSPPFPFPLSRRLSAFLLLTKPQVSRVVVTNNGAIPTRFTVTAKKFDASVETRCSSSSQPPHPETPSTGKPNMPFPEEHQVVDRGEGTKAKRNESPLNGSNTGGDSINAPQEGQIYPSSSVTDELLRKALAVGEVETRYPEGKGAIEVEGGGELDGYGSSEIVVTFAPLELGEFQTVQVGALPRFVLCHILRLKKVERAVPRHVFPLKFREISYQHHQQSGQFLPDWLVDS